MDNRPIGFLDSGVGGLTVVRELKRQLPHESIVYIGDSARAPYGPRPAGQIREYTWQLVKFLLTKDVKMIVIACNTATAVVWEEIKESLDIPVLGVVLPGSSAAIKSSRGVRLTHIPTGIVVASTVDRTQYGNRDRAMKMLQAKLYQMEQEKKAEEVNALKGDKKEITWGSQIRSYVFTPYTMVKDHRTGYEVAQVDKVMDGDIEGFIDAYLKWRMEE